MNVIWIIKNIAIVIVLVCSSKQDYYDRNISNYNSIILLIIGIIYRVSRIGVSRKAIITILLSVVCIIMLYVIIYFVMAGGIGGGDIKLLIGLGSCIGFCGSIWCFVVASILFLGMSLIKIVLLKKRLHELYPFVPYLLIAFIIKLCIFQTTVCS